MVFHVVSHWRYHFSPASCSSRRMAHMPYVEYILGDILSGNQTWQWKIYYLQVIFLLKPLSSRFPIATFDNQGVASQNGTFIVVLSMKDADLPQLCQLTRLRDSTFLFKVKVSQQTSCDSTRAILQYHEWMLDPLSLWQSTMVRQNLRESPEFEPLVFFFSWDFLITFY